MVEGLFAKGTVGLLAGEGKIGKSLLVQQLATCAVMNAPWLGLNVTQGPAVYFACEDDEDELMRRQEDINRHLDIEHADAGERGLTIATRLNCGSNILSKVDDRREIVVEDEYGRKQRVPNPDYGMMVETDLFIRVVSRCKKLGVRYLFIDTQAQTFAGRLMDFQHTIQFMAQLRRLAVAIDGLVILVTHPSDNGRRMRTGEAGSTQWVNAARSHVYVHKTTKKEGGQLVVELMRGNYSSRGLKIPIVWDKGIFRRVDQQMTIPGYQTE